MNGSGRGPTLVLIAYTECVAVTYRVRKSGPPQCRFEASSGTRTLPRRSPLGANTHTPPGAVTHTLPEASHFMPSGTPASRSDLSPLAKVRPKPSEPSGLTSNTRMLACTVSLT